MLFSLCVYSIRLTFARLFCINKIKKIVLFCAEDLLLPKTDRERYMIRLKIYKLILSSNSFIDCKRLSYSSSKHK